MRQTKLADGRKAWEVCPEKSDTMASTINLIALVFSLIGGAYLINLFQ